MLYALICMILAGSKVSSVSVQDQKTKSMAASITGTATENTSLLVESPAFKHNDNIPVEYTCDGRNVNPPLIIRNIPPATKTLAIIVDDPDAPSGTWVHWVVWNIIPSGHIAENSQPGEEGMNDFRKTRYMGPCPPGGTHRYFFRVYALDIRLSISPASNKYELEEAMNAHILAQGEITGLYSRE